MMLGETLLLQPHGHLNVCLTVTIVPLSHLVCFARKTSDFAISLCNRSYNHNTDILFAPRSLYSAVPAREFGYLFDYRCRVSNTADTLRRKHVELYGLRRQLLRRVLIRPHVDFEKPVFFRPDKVV